MPKSILAIYHQLGKNKWLYLTSTILLLISIFARSFEPKVLQMIVDHVITPYFDSDKKIKTDQLVGWITGFIPASKTLNYKWLLFSFGLFYIIISIVRGGALFGAMIMKHKATQDTIKKLRDKLFLKIQQLPLSFLYKFSKGELIQRSTGDIDTVKDFIDQQITAFLRLISMFVFAFALMFSMNSTYASYCVFLSPIIFIVSYLYFIKEKKIWKQHELEADRLNDLVQENLNGIRTITAFTNQSYEIRRFKMQNLRKMKMGMKQTRLQAFYKPLIELLVNLQLIIAIASGGYFVITGTITLGVLVGFYAYISSVTYPLKHLGKVLSNMGMAMVAMDRIQEVLEHPDESDEGSHIPETLSGHIKFENVSFSYDGIENVLEDITFEIQAGEKIAFIGPTGAGKSTLIKLLLRLYEPTKGTIYIDGVPLPSYPKPYLRKKIGVAFQRAFLFSTTIKENIIYAEKESNLEQIDEAVKHADIHNFKYKFPKGFDTIVGEKGVTLSGGQKQRVSLARTVLIASKILVLDDTTSAVDNHTEKNILKTLDTYKDKTIIIIAHRIASIRKADRIIVLRKGKIEKIGTPDALKNSEGYYSDIETIQDNIETKIMEEEKISSL